MSPAKVSLCLFFLTTSSLIVTSVPAFNGNLFLDTLLAAVKGAYRGKLDSFDLPSKEVKWNHLLGMFNMSGTAHLHNGFVAGLNTIKRSSDAFIRHLPQNKTTIVTKLAGGPLVATYQGKVAMWGIGPSIQVDVQIKTIEVDTTLLLDDNTRKARIVEFNLDKFEGFTAKLNTPGFLTDPIINLILKFVMPAIEPAIRYGLSTYLKNALTNAAATVLIPGATTERSIGGW